MKSVTQAWLNQQCHIIDGVNHAIVLMPGKNNTGFTPVAHWPSCTTPPPTLLTMARETIKHQRNLVHQAAGSPLCNVIGFPIKFGNSMVGVIAINIEHSANTGPQAALQQLQHGCAWLNLLIQQEGKASKHYLATMLEMAALFLEHQQEQPTPADTATDHVITRIIDALTEHVDTDTSALLKQIHETVHHARGVDDKPTGPAVPGTEHDTLASDIPAALADGQFELHYLPKLDLRTGRITGMEALLRWDHPQAGLLPPDRFLPVAEDSGQMVAIDTWVLRTACRQLQQWQTAGHDSLSMAVNLSADTYMQSRLVRQLLTITDEAGIAPAKLEIEITECTVMNNIDTAATVMRSLHDAGIRISVDDFGTGYSSLNFLQRLPISTVKIDRSFVRDITLDPDIATIVRGIIAMAHACGLDVIAEGVETEAQLAFLRNLQCDQFQGYLFSMPLPQEAAGQLLKMEATAGCLLNYIDRAS